MNRRTRILIPVILAVILTGILAALNFYVTFYRDNIKSLEEQPEIRIYRDFDYDRMIDEVLKSGAVDNE